MKLRITNLERALTLVFFCVSSVFCYSQNAQASYITSVSSQWSDVSGGIYYNTGNVGIGITNPVSNFDLRGTLNVSSGLSSNFSTLNPNILLKRTNLILQTTYEGSAFTGWNNPTPTYVAWSNTTPGNGFSGTVMRFGITGGAQSQRSWTSSGAMTAEFILNHTYRISFKYRSDGPFTVKDRDSSIVSVPANTGNAKFFTYDYTKTVDSWTSRNLLLYFGDSAAVTWAEVDELLIEDITSPTYSPALFADAAGNVGVGTNSPAEKFTVKDNGTTASILAGYHADDQSPYLAGFFNDAYSTSVPVFEYFGWNSGMFSMGTRAANDFQLYTGSYSNPRITIMGGGNVGIGTVTPVKQFEVGGTGQAKFDSFAYGTTPVATDTLALATVEYVNGSLVNGTGPWKRTAPYVYPSTLTDNVGIGTTSPETKLMVVGANIPNSTYTTPGNLMVATSDAVGADIGGSISLAGRWFSGLTTNSNFARISGRKEGATDGNAAGYLAFEVSNNINPYTAERMRITSVGNVGIGTTNPGARLEIQPAVNGNTQIRLRTPGYSYWDITSVNNLSDSDLTFSMGGSEKARFNNAGRLGLGNNNPQYKLDIVGDLKSTTNGWFRGSSDGTSAVALNLGRMIDAESPLASISTDDNTGDILKFKINRYTSKYSFDYSGPAYSKGVEFNSNYTTGTQVNLYNEAESTKVYLNTNGASYFLGGNVGVGLAGPVKLFNVAGQAKFDSFAYGTTPVATDTLALATVEYVNGKAGGAGGVGTGITGQTLRNNGTGWVADSNLFNTGTNIGIGTTAPQAKFDLTGDFYSYGVRVERAKWGAGSASAGKWYRVGVMSPSGGTYDTRIYKFAVDCVFPDKNKFNAEATVSYRGGTLTTESEEWQYKVSGVPTQLKLQQLASNNFELYVYSPYGYAYCSNQVEYSGEGTSDLVTLDATATEIANSDQGTAVAQTDNWYYATGNVGVGTTDPQYKLDVNGILRVQGNQIRSGAGQLSFFNGTGGSWAPIGVAGINMGDWDTSPVYGDILVGTYNFDVLRDDGSSMLTILNGGNVGMGITAPTKLLHVAGQAKFDSFAYGTTPVATDTLALATVEYVNGKSGGAGGVGTGITGQTLRHNGTGWVANSTLYNNGTNVGIGTTNPGSLLHVYGGNITVDNIAATDAQIRFYNAGALSSLVYRPGNTNDLRIYTGGTDRFSVISTGNVGVGITNPSMKFHVQGSAYVKDVTRDGNFRHVLSTGFTSTAVNGYLLTTAIPYEGITNRGMHTIRIQGFAYGYNEPIDFVVNFYLYSSGFSTYAWTNYGAYNPGTVKLSYEGNVLKLWWSNVLYYPSFEVFTTSWIGAVDVNSYFEGWTITDAAAPSVNVVDVPYANAEPKGLTMAGNLSLNGNWLSGDGGGEGVYVISNGNVGVGTAGPAKLLQVAGQAKFDSFAYGTTPVATDTLALATVEYVNGKSGGAGGVGTGITGQTLRHNGTGWVADSTLFNTATNIGIGTNNPLYKLDVNGTANLGNTTTFGATMGTITWGSGFGGGVGFGIQAGTGRNLSLGSNGSWDQLLINSGGNVGIGLTNPTRRLDVNGDIENLNSLGNKIITGGVIQVNGYKEVAQGATVAITGGTLVSGGPTARNGYGSWDVTSFPQTITISSRSWWTLGGLSFIGGDVYGSQTNRLLPKSFLIEKSADNVSWTTLADVTNNTNNYYFLDGFSDAPYIKITVRAPQDTRTGSAIALLQVFETHNVGIGNGPFTVSHEGNAVFVGGNVGVGAVTPGKQLEVGGTGQAKFNSFAYGTTPVSTDTLALTTVEYVNGRINTAGQWTRTAPYIYPTTLTDNVGIGATNPKEKLEVVGNLRVGSDGELNVYSVSGGSCPGCGTETIALQTTIDFRTIADGLPFDSATRHSLALQPTWGYVGIGTTNPTNKLEVNEGLLELGGTTGSAHGILMDRGSAVTTSALQGSIFQEWNGLSNAESMTSRSYSFKWQKDDGTNWMVINASGNVGVGTTSPNAKLSVVGTTRINGDFVGNGTGFFLSAASTHYTPANNIPTAMIRTDDAEAGPENTLSSLVLYNSNGGQNTGANLTFASRESTTGGNDVALSGIFGWKISAGTAGSWSTGGLKFWTKNGSSVVNAMAIDNIGNVGIATAGPTKLLNVAGQAKFDSFAYGTTPVATDTLALATVEYVNGRINTAGPWMRTAPYVYPTTLTDNVGIGTTNPVTLLELKSSNNDLVTLNRNGWSGGEEANILFSHNGSYNAKIGSWVEGAGSMVALRFFTVDAGTQSQKMVIRGNGNVGVGTTAPGAKLEVGTVNQNYWVISGYSKTYVQAKAACIAAGGRLMTYAEMVAAFKNGANSCDCGWMEDNIAGYPMQNGADGGCGGAVGGVRICTSDLNALMSAYCAKDTIKDNGSLNLSGHLATKGLFVNNGQSTDAAYLGFVQNGANADTLRFGLGTTTPAYKLDVRSGDVNIDINQAYRTNTNRVLMQNNSDVNVGLVDYYSYSKYNNSNSGTYQLIVGNPAAVLMTARGDIASIGIGTTAPAKLLNVAGQAKFDSFAYGTTPVATDTLALTTVEYVNGRINTAGQWTRTAPYIYPTTLTDNVGVGTTNPSQKLVVSSINTSPLLNAASVTSSSLLISNSDTGYGTFFASLGSGVGLIQQRRQATAAYYDLALNPYGGNVGIGTTNPIFKLDVNGAARLNYFYKDFQILQGADGNGLVRTWNGPLVASSDISGALTYTVIETNVPQASTMMGGFTIQWFENYNATNAKTTIDLSGYWNPESNSGFIGFEYTSSNPEVAPTIRVASKTSNGNTVFILTHFNSSYPVIVAKDLWLSYGGGANNYGDNWAILQTNDISAYSNIDTVVANVPTGGSGTTNYIPKWTTTKKLGNSLIYDNGTNVGIGITAPTKLLNVAGQAKFDSFAYGTTPVATDTLALATVEYVNGRINTSGPWARTAPYVYPTTLTDNVGIGLTNPSNILEIKGATPSSGTVGYGDGTTYTGQLYIESSDAYTTQRGGRLALGGIAGANGGAFTGHTHQDSVYGTIEGFKANSSANNAGGGLIFSTNYNPDGNIYERMRITDGGNIGIGISNPNSRLHSYNFSADGTAPGRTSIIDVLTLETTNTASAPYRGFGQGIEFRGRTYSNGTIRTLGRIATVLTDDSITDTGTAMIFQTVASSSVINAPTEKMRIDSFGNIGIGLSNPADRLQVTGGNIRLEDNSTYALKKRADSVKNLIYTSRSDDTQPGLFRTDGWGNFTTDGSFGVGYDLAGFGSGGPGDGNLYTSGKIGVGTTAPTKQFEVAGTGQAKFNSFAYGTTPVSTDTLALATVEYVNGQVAGSTNGWTKGGDTLTLPKTLGTINTYPLPFITNNVERMRITDAGNLAIGATTTDARLYVDGPQQAVALFRSRLNGGNYSGYIGNGQTASAEEFGLYYAIGDYRLATYDITSGSLMYGNGIVINNTSNNVGIGVTNPAARLDVSGDAKFAGDLYVNGSDILLSQNGSGYSTVGLKGTASGLYVGVNLKNDGAKESDAAVAWRSQYINTGDAYYVQRSAAGTSAWTSPFSINANGNVGIGISSATKPLQVAGQAKFDGYAYGLTPVATDTLALATVEYVNSKSGGPNGMPTGTANQTLRHNGTGWAADSTLLNNGSTIGIGTAPSSYKLDVNGDFRASGIGNFESSSDQILQLKQLGIAGTAGVKNAGWNYIGFLDSEGDRQGYFGIDSSGNFAFSPEIAGTGVNILSNAYVSGNLGVGVAPSIALDINGSARIRSTSDGSGNLRFDAANPYIYASSYIVMPGGLYVSGGTLYANNQAQLRGGVHNDNATYLTIAGGTAGHTYFSGNVGVGTTNPGKLLHVAGQAKFDDYAYGTTPTAADTLALATVEYVNARAAGGSFLPLSGGTMSGDINMGQRDITNLRKLTVTTIDPLYNINGINYSTYASSMSGGVKEEYVDKIMIAKKVATSEYETVIDFANVKEGSDLWVWYKAIEFNKNNVEVLITPYGRLAQVYYIIEDNKIIFRADRATEVSYRLIGKRFDWRKWPTKAIDQTEKGMEIK